MPSDHSAIPSTVYLVFTKGWIDLNHAPVDAAEWYRKGYLQIVNQGKLPGYVVTPKTYALIVDDAMQE